MTPTYEDFDITKLVAGEVMVLRTCLSNWKTIYPAMSSLSQKTCDDLVNYGLLKELKKLPPGVNMDERLKEKIKNYQLTRLGKKIAKVLG
jgi:hypothetical protein